MNCNFVWHLGQQTHLQGRYIQTLNARRRHEVFASKQRCLLFHGQGVDQLRSHVGAARAGLWLVFSVRQHSSLHGYVSQRLVNASEMCRCVYIVCALTFCLSYGLQIPRKSRSVDHPPPDPSPRLNSFRNSSSRARHLVTRGP